MKPITRKKIGEALAGMIGSVLVIDNVEQEFLSYQFTPGRLLVVTDELLFEVYDQDAIELVDFLKKVRESPEQARKRSDARMAELEKLIAQSKQHCDELQKRLNELDQRYNQADDNTGET